MCGIAGMFSLGGTLPPALRAALPAMTAAISHRGPDGDGFFDDGIAALGHRRLAIIDVAGGRQPLANEDGTVWITFNGEIYNYRPLRDLLIDRGHVFRTNSDTETIVHAYEEFGPGCVDRLEGMFAFAVYDQKQRELFIARDRLGKKPCYVARFGETLHFASELRALKASPAFDATLASNWIESYLALGYIIAPATAYKHVSQLEPGYWLRASTRGIERQRYWDVTEFDTDRRSEPAVLNSLDRTLRAAVEARLESEVPLGAFLSGGIDSGLVVSYMADQAVTAPTTVSVGFEVRAHNELEAAGVTAAAFKTDHHPHVISPKLDGILDRLIEAFGEPFADPSCVPTYFVSKAAREHVTVALSGDGGDEAFAGYDFRYVPHAIEAFGRRFLSPAVARSLASRWPRSARLPKPLRLGTLLDNVSVTPAQAYYADLCFVKPGDVARLLGRDPSGSLESATASAVTEVYDRCPSPDAVQKAEYADLKIYLPNGPLTKVDRMSMLHSLEVRCPLLDRSVVEFGFRLPVATKMPRLKGKHILRSLARRRLPPEIGSLPKHGFSAPAGEWITGDCREQFEADVLSPRSAFSNVADVSQARRLFDEHRRGAFDRTQVLWGLWVLGRWLAISAAVPSVA
jgi:asparagine synthase (glutamine-hydrolysing)